MSPIRKNPPSRVRGKEGAWREALPDVLRSMRGKPPEPGSPAVPPLSIGVAAKRHGVSYDTLRDAAHRDPFVRTQLEMANAEGAELCQRMAVNGEAAHGRHWLWILERLDLRNFHIATKVDATISGKDGAPPVATVVRFPVNALGADAKR